MSVGYSRRTSVKAFAQGLDARRDQRLQLGLDAVLLEPGSSPRSSCVVERPRAARPERLALGALGDDHVSPSSDRAGRAHPVQGLVGLGVAVHGDRAVGLQHEQSGRLGEPGSETPLVGDRAAGDDDTHVRVVARGGPSGHARTPPACPRAFFKPRGRYARAVTFYDEVMRELVAAIGAALLVANVIALARRNKDSNVRGARSARAASRRRAAHGSSPPAAPVRVSWCRPPWAAPSPSRSSASSCSWPGSRRCPSDRPATDRSARGGTPPAASRGAGPAPTGTSRTCSRRTGRSGSRTGRSGADRNAASSPGDVYTFPLSPGAVTSRQHFTVGSNPLR